MIVGIDLGTTNSLVAYYTEEGPKIIPNRLGEHLTPSVISIDEEDRVYIGKTAKERMLLYPDTAASVFKRDMGSEKEFKFGNKTFKAEELSSFVLRSLKEDAEEFLGEEVTEAVISVPAYFNDERRKATKRAGELAGLKVERIISEPTAAAIAYGLYQSKENAKFLVFDLGGGTFDVSILELFENILEVHAVAGDNFLGGEDFTAVIVDLFFNEFKELSKEKLSQKELKHINKQAEKCKIGFEDGRVSKMSCVIQEKNYDFELSVDSYEKACEELFDRMKEPVKKSLSDAGVKLSDIDKVVLVGGATKLTLVRKFVSRLFRTMPDLNINPDEAVALGAAIQGAMKERKDSIREVILTDVCPFTLGTEVVVQNEAERYEEGHFCPIIERNTIIPASRTERVYTAHDYQPKIRVKVLQGESRYAKNNLFLGELNVDVPKKKAGEVAIDITYTYDINSLLEVEVKVLGTDTKITQIIKNQYTKMSEEEIKQRFEELSYLKIHPRDQEENKLLLLRGERLYEENLGEERKIIEHHIMKFESVLDSHDQKRINRQREEFKEFLDSYEDFN